ncbi:uncharacterized protein LOC122504905 [Leptopilina heterotoma]|uniref:uncharacterized protein LOC122504905 n=1 Tax=Leptopilina heterotoma TaxID=63436 RepID=UPI001CA9E49E|nr:uncharacterized protein LOC122504905 [Leptopilina heterotoma]
MEQNSKIPTIFDSELLNEISKTNCGIKYPKNILSCLKSMNFYNHLELCPHYCPVGKIIKICSTSSGISSIWVAASSQVLPINGEALYILKRNSEILKNDFPLIGFRGKNFTRLNVHMFKIDDICIHRTVHQLEIGVKIYFKHWEKCSLHLVEIPREGIKITIREPTTLKLSSEGSKFAEFPKTMEETESKDFLAASSAVAVSLSSSSLSSSSLLSSTAVATTTTTKAASLFTSSSAATTTAKEASLASSKAVVTASLSSSEAVVTASLSSKAVVSESLPTIKEAAATKEASLSSVTTTEAAVLLASLSSSVASKAVVTASLSLSKAVVTSSKAVVAASLSSSTAASSKAVVSESLPTTKEAAATKEASLSSVATTEPAKVVASLSTSKAAVTASLSSSKAVVAASLSSSTAASSKAVVATSLSLSEAVLAGSLSSSEAVVASLSSEAPKVLAAASLSSETVKVAVASLLPAETDATTVAAPTFGLSSSSSESSIYCTRGSTSDEITTEESYENFGFVNEESLSNEGPKKTLHDHCHHCPNESNQTNESSETDCPATETVGELDTNNVPATHFGINQKSFRIHKTESNTPTNTVSKKLFPKTKKNSSSKYKILSQTDEIIAKVETYLESQVPIPYQKCYPLLESVSVMEKSQLDLDSQVPCLNYNANVKNDQIPNDEIPCYENCLPFENLTMTRFHLMNANFMRKTELKFPQWPVNDLTNYSSGSSMSNVEFYFGAHTTPSYENIKERSQVNSDELLTKIFTFLFRQFDFMIVILLCLLLLFIYYILIHYKGDQ